ncbi:MAG: transposase [Dehalococcoidia bacterium]|nr:transposase [Dehalococcoidia bacterium]
MYGLTTDCVCGGKLEGFSSCDFEVRVNPEDDIRLFGGAIRRDGPEWETTYRKRWSVERVFKRYKERSVLDNHSFRRISRVRLLIQMYAITYVATRLAEKRNTNRRGD